MSVKRTFLSVWGMILAGVVWAQPRLAVDRDVANMGEIMFQLPSKVNFTLRNTGTDPLSIKEVIPSCGCTAVDWTRELIAPGAEGTITAVYDAKMLGVFQKDLNIEILALLAKEQLKMVQPSKAFVNHSVTEVFQTVLFTFLRGICTEKGMVILERYALKHSYDMLLRKE